MHPDSAPSSNAVAVLLSADSAPSSLAQAVTAEWPVGARHDRFIPSHQYAVYEFVQAAFDFYYKARTRKQRLQAAWTCVNLRIRYHNRGIETGRFFNFFE